MNLKVSQKHGVNPSLDHCFYCGRSTGIALLGKLPGDKEAPRNICSNKEPCEECKAHMKLGVMLVQVGDGGEKDPQPTGRLVVVKDEVIGRMITPPSLAAQIIQKRLCFIPKEA